MADFSQMTPSQVALGIRELDGLADALSLPDDERCGILGLSGSVYRLWQSGLGAMAGSTSPELVRRLSYALPLMRRMAANRRSGTTGYNRTPAYPMAD